MIRGSCRCGKTLALEKNAVIDLHPDKTKAIDPLTVIQLLDKLGPVALAVLRRLAEIFRNRKEETPRTNMIAPSWQGLHDDLEHKLQEVVRATREIARETPPVLDDKGEPRGS